MLSIRPEQLEHMNEQCATALPHPLELVDGSTSRWVRILPNDCFIISQEVMYPPEAGGVELEFTSKYIDWREVSEQDKIESYESFGLTEEEFWKEYPAKGKQLICELVFQWTT